MAPRPAATAPPNRSAAASVGEKESGTGTILPPSLTRRKADDTARNAAHTASPPPRGTGIVFTRLASGRSTIS